MRQPFEARVLVLRRDTLGLALGAVIALAGQALFLLAFTLPAPLKALSFLAILLFLFGAGGMYSSFGRSPEPATVRAGRLGLLIDGKLVAADRITGVALRPCDGGAKVTVSLRYDVRLEMVVKDDQEGRRLLQALAPPPRRAAEADAFARGEVAVEAFAVARGARSTRAWIERLRAIAAGATASHRTAPPAPERLTALVGSPSAPASLRAAAAIALGPRLDPALRRRLAEVAPPALRITLEAAFDPAREGDLEALLVELEGMDAGDAEPGAARAPR